MNFPYERYQTLTEPLTLYYPVGEEERARRIAETINKANQQLSQLLQQNVPVMNVYLITAEDWQHAPKDELEDENALLPYWTTVTTPPSMVIPLEIDPIFGEATPEKLAFVLYHVVTLAFLETDTRPWPEDYPLWADEWQLKFAALWLAQVLDGQQGVVNKDLHEQYAEIFQPEPDGKTPVTIRGFDWYEDTDVEDYLEYELLLERFAADLLDRYDPEVLPRFLPLYRVDKPRLLSDDVTAMLAEALGPGGAEWLEELVYF